MSRRESGGMAVAVLCLLVSAPVVMAGRPCGVVAELGQVILIRIPVVVARVVCCMPEYFRPGKIRQYNGFRANVNQK